MDVVAQMKKFIEPESVALIGVSRTLMSIGRASIDVLPNLISYGYEGKIYPIHPQASEIQGLKAYAAIAEVPGNIDLAVIDLPRDLVPGMLRQCVDKGIKAVIIITQGFSDANDGRGKQLQKEIDDARRGTSTRILGPNTLGTANAYIKFSSGFMETQMEEIPVGFVCQSGVFFLGPDGLKLMGKGIDLGNSSDINISDGVEYFGQDTGTKVIGLHIEGTQDSRRFLEVANRVAHKKPVVALKTGKNEWAAQAAQAHTSSLVGKGEIWDAALKQAGVIRVDDVEELGDTIRTFYTLPLMKGRRVGIVTYTGGFGVMGIDACQKSGLEVARFSPATINRLSALCPSWQRVSNPIDVAPMLVVTRKASFIEAPEIATKTLFADPEVDAVLCIVGAVDPSLGIGLRQLAEEVAISYPDKPLVFYFYGPFSTEVKHDLEAKGKTLSFSSPDRAIRALGHLADYAEFRAVIPPKPS